MEYGQQYIFFKIVYEDKEIRGIFISSFGPNTFAFEPNFLSKFDKKVLQ